MTILISSMRCEKMGVTEYWSDEKIGRLQYWVLMRYSNTPSPPLLRL